MFNLKQFSKCVEIIEGILDSLGRRRNWEKLQKASRDRKTIARLASSMRNGSSLRSVSKQGRSVQSALASEGFGRLIPAAHHSPLQT